MLTGRSDPPRFAFAPGCFYPTRLHMTSPLPPIASPCVGVCTLDADGYCVGCLRTGDEIGAWRSLDDRERARFMDEVLPQREVERVRA
jgi:predicted Fe-S protein YdhL (DUF1289 family)